VFGCSRSVVRFGALVALVRGSVISYQRLQQ
jgi:hypothetical protein